MESTIMTGNYVIFLTAPEGRGEALMSAWHTADGQYMLAIIRGAVGIRGWFKNVTFGTGLYRLEIWALHYLAMCEQIFNLCASGFWSWNGNGISPSLSKAGMRIKWVNMHKVLRTVLSKQEVLPEC